MEPPPTVRPSPQPARHRTRPGEVVGGGPTAEPHGLDDCGRLESGAPDLLMSRSVGVSVEAGKKGVLIVFVPFNRYG